jgi:O-antigen/teichoic acid export membrane protein
MSTASVSHALQSSLVTSLGVKILSFLISVITVRFTSVSGFGRISVQYQLYVSLPLFLMKEGFRRSAIRESDPGISKHVAVVGIVFTIILIILCGFALVLVNSEDIHTVWLISIGLVIETFAEIFLIHKLVVMKNFASRTMAETWSSFLRSFSLLFFLYHEYSPGTAFGFAQVVYGLCWFVLLAKNVHIRSVVEAIVPSSSFPVTNVVEMGLSAIQKLLLTEGERILAVSILSADEMGQLGLITNLGSIVLRLFFAPIEDIAFTGLARTKKISDRLRIIQSIFAIQFTVGLLGAVVGPLAARHVIHILYGPNWSSRPEVVVLLQAYCVFLLTCSANGPLEAYYFAIADSKKVRYAMISQAIAFAIFVLVVVTINNTSGSLAIVVGNTIAMLVRIGWSTTAFPSARDFLHPQLRVVVVRVLLAGLVAWTLILTSGVGDRIIVSLGLVASMALVTLGSIFRTLRAMLSDAKNV